MRIALLLWWPARTSAWSTIEGRSADQNAAGSSPRVLGALSRRDQESTPPRGGFLAISEVGLAAGRSTPPPEDGRRFAVVRKRR